MALFLLGETFGAERAEAWGLVHAVVPDEEVAQHATEIARTLAAGPTAAYVAVKELINANQGAGLAEVLEREAAVQQQLGISTDHATAVEAFLAKRRPSFVGH